MSNWLWDFVKFCGLFRNMSYSFVRTKLECFIKISLKRRSMNITIFSQNLFQPIIGRFHYLGFRVYISIILSSLSFSNWSLICYAYLHQLDLEPTITSIGQSMSYYPDFISILSSFHLLSYKDNTRAGLL